MYSIDTVRQHAHLHSWILNTLFFILWIADIVVGRYCCRHEVFQKSLDLNSISWGPFFGRIFETVRMDIEAGKPYITLASRGSAAGFLIDAVEHYRDRKSLKEIRILYTARAVLHLPIELPKFTLLLQKNTAMSILTFFGFHWWRDRCLPC